MPQKSVLRVRLLHSFLLLLLFPTYGTNSATIEPMTRGDAL